MDKQFRNKYIKYKLKYKQYKINMIGGANIYSQISRINNFISKINSSSENQSDIINLLESYIIKQDIPIHIDFNSDNKDDLNRSIEKLKSLIEFNNLTKLYEQREKIYELDETNTNEILDYIINSFNIRTISDIENLFHTVILGHNKNYIIYYMVLLRFLIKNKQQINVLERHLSILSLHGLKMCLNPQINLDDYLTLIIKLIQEYINSFPIKKRLIIKKPSEFESDRIVRSKLVELENDIIPNNQIILYDTKNKIFQYESGEIKSIELINWDDLVQILFNLFRIKIFI
jgi:hypothetical protein